VQSGWYFYGDLDGFYENVRLPTFSQGLLYNFDSNVPGANLLNRFQPNPVGGGVRGEVGYYLPGANLRLGIGGSFAYATGDQSQAGQFQPNDDSRTGFVLLNGEAQGGYACFATLVPETCNETGKLGTRYNSWNAHAKAQFDPVWAFGGAISPYAALIGGATRVDQTLDQTLDYVRLSNGTTAIHGSYAAQTALNWDDAGARIGIEAKLPIGPVFAFNVSGSLSFIGRGVEMSGTDSANLFCTAPCSGGSTGNSAISDSASTFAYQASAEAGATLKLSPAFAFRAFGGITYDDRVPGITPANFTGTLIGLSPKTPIPASIFFAPELSWHIGGGLSAQF